MSFKEPKFSTSPGSKMYDPSGFINRKRRLGTRPSLEKLLATPEWKGSKVHRWKTYITLVHPSGASCILYKRKASRR